MTNLAGRRQFDGQTVGGESTAAVPIAASPSVAHMRRTLEMAGVASVVAGIGWLDYVTGLDVGFSLFYMLPVTAVAVRRSRRAAIAVAVLASATWLAADAALRTTDNLWISAWNGGTRLAIFVTIAVLITRLREEHGRTQDLNARLEKLLAHEADLARTDPLTGLSNSRFFQESIAARLPAREPAALAFVDLDNFKTINDRFGHAAGDDLLGQVARALRESVRDGDVVARLGGDEFGVLLLGLGREASRAIAERIVQRVGEIGARFPGAALGATVGVAYSSSGEVAGEDLLRQADSTMYEAKAQGKSRAWLRDVGDSAAIPPIGSLAP